MLTRLYTTLLGIALLAYGVIAGLSPLPGGVVFVVIGLLMIAGANPAARPAVRRLRRRWPWFNALVKTLGRRGPSSIRTAEIETDPGDPEQDKSARSA